MQMLGFELGYKAAFIIIYSCGMDAKPSYLTRGK